MNETDSTFQNVTLLGSIQQGSILGQTLFIIYINDLSKV